MASSEIDFDALRRLSVPERLQLVADLWDSIASDAPDEAFPMTPDLAAELDRRWADYVAIPRRLAPGRKSRLRSGSDGPSPPARR